VAHRVAEGITDSSGEIDIAKHHIPNRMDGKLADWRQPPSGAVHHLMRKQSQRIQYIFTDAFGGNIFGHRSFPLRVTVSFSSAGQMRKKTFCMMERQSLPPQLAIFGVGHRKSYEPGDRIYACTFDEQDRKPPK
jgi:hypothetical protein